MTWKRIYRMDECRKIETSSSWTSAEKISIEFGYSNSRISNSPIKGEKMKAQKENMEVSILMPTYNHEKYIEKAIDSVLMQKTKFKWELLIHDDCSTDGTLGIVKKYTSLYPDHIKLYEESENQGLMKSYKKLIDVSRGDYIAVLESDDYWTDECKLQTQVDFLNENPDYAMVFTDVIVIDENGNKIQNKKTINSHVRNTEKWYEQLLGHNGITGACSAMFRKSDFLEYCNIDEYIERNFVTFDYPVWLSLSFHKKCKYFQTVMAAYRIVPTSLSNNANTEKHMNFELSIAEIDAYIISKYGLGSLTEKEYNHRICIRMIGKALKFRKHEEFHEYAKKLSPQSFKERIMHYVPSLYYWLFCLLHNKK